MQKDFRKKHDYDDADELHYNALEYTNENIVSLLEHLPMKKVRALDSMSNSYNLTANFTITINNKHKKIQNELQLNDVDLFIRSPINLKQQECLLKKGLWSYENQSCYRYYVNY